MEDKMGLSDVYEHYIDRVGNKYFSTYNTFYGSFIRQVQLVNGDVLDASSGNPFRNKMIELGFVCDDNKLFNIFDNYEKFDYRVWGSNSGIPNLPKKM